MKFCLYMAATSSRAYYSVTTAFDADRFLTFRSQFSEQALNWFGGLYVIDLVFFSSLGIFMFAGSAVVYRNRKLPRIFSQFGWIIAALSLVMIVADAGESALATYMMLFADSVSSELAIIHSALFFVAVLLDGMVLTYLFLALILLINRKLGATQAL